MDKVKAVDQILGMPEFEKSQYESVDLDRLLMYAVARLEDLKVELSLENIIVATFKLFPRKFSLIGYSQFPDATRVEKCLWRSKGKKRGWVSGSTPHGYLLTDRGRLIADQAASLLSAPFASKTKTMSQTKRNFKRKSGFSEDNHAGIGKRRHSRVPRFLRGEV